MTRPPCAGDPRDADRFLVGCFVFVALALLVAVILWSGLHVVEAVR